MHPPETGILLDAWERGLRQTRHQQLLIVMSAFMPDRSQEEIASLPVGRRDAALLEFYEQMFGTRMDAVASCPTCGEELEAEIAVPTLQTSRPPNDPKVRTCSAAGHQLSFRLPTTEDLIAIPPGSAALDARRLLLRRCVLQARDPAGLAIDPVDMPEPVTRALSARMAKLDPQANIVLSLLCPACGRTFNALLDVATFVLRQLHGWAQRILVEIHSLASAYGWSETQILALSPARRRLYLELLAR